MLEDKFKTIEFNINGITELNRHNLEQIKKNNENISDLRGLFKNNFNLVISDLTNIINHLESNNKKTEEIEEESPASKITSLNLNWIPVEGATNFNEVKNVYKTGSYWCVKSEEVLDGPFICRILAEHVGDGGTWSHGVGIVKAEFESMESYYSYSCLFLSNGYCSKSYDGNYNQQIPKSRNWQDGDEIIIKRDYDNDLWFGLNNEFEMVKSCKAEGKFRIVLGFLNSSNKSHETFKLIQLQPLSM